jgi:hypothetical protein
MTVQWFGKINIAHVLAVAKKSEKETAERIAADAISNCPVGEWERDGGGLDSWKARKPGSLKASIRVEKSKFEDGGYYVMAGDKDIFYAHFVELGVPAHAIPKDPFLRNAAKKERKRFFKMLKRSLT